MMDQVFIIICSEITRYQFLGTKLLPNALSGNVLFLTIKAYIINPEVVGGLINSSCIECLLVGAASILLKSRSKLCPSRFTVNTTASFALAAESYHVFSVEEWYRKVLTYFTVFIPEGKTCSRNQSF